MVGTPVVGRLSNHTVSCCLSVSADGGAESSALVDDNGSEGDYSYEDLCRASPRYLQPGGEQLAVNEVLEGIPHSTGHAAGPLCRAQHPLIGCSLLLLFFFFFVFLLFLGPLPWQMGVPRLGVESEL